jgi:tricorn protease-like protein
MKKAPIFLKKKMKTVSQITTVSGMVALLIITILLTGTTITTSAVWATNGTVSSGNGTDTDVTTQIDEGLTEEDQQVETVEEQQPSSNQTESTTEEEEEEENTTSSSIESPLLEPSVPLNQSETVEPSENFTTTAAANATNATATNATTTSNGQMAFSSSRDGNYEIYAMNADDGSNMTRLTDNDASDFDPTWSPDGEKIAFASFRDGFRNEEIYIMNAEGSEQTKLTNNIDALDREPSWSTDGEKIAFASNRDGDYEIYVMNADGSGQTRLTDEPGWDREPSWSTDGEKIAFVSERDNPPRRY